MKTFYFLVLLLVATTAHAQDCGGTANAGGTCVPPDVAMPDTQQQTQAPQSPPQKWVDHYGAISTDGPSGSFGAATNMPNQSDAEGAALTNCRSKKWSSNCKVELWYINQCAAMVVGDAGHNAKAGTTPTAATQAAMKVCNSEDNHCFVYYTGCSLPTRIQ